MLELKVISDHLPSNQSTTHITIFHLLDGRSILAQPPSCQFYNPGSDISLKCIIRRHLIQNAAVIGILLDLQSTEIIRKVDIGPE